MFKLLILFPQPPQPPFFEQQWSERLVPLCEALPGLLRITVSHTQGGPAGPVPIYLVHELYFADRAALTAAMESPQGEAAGQMLMRLAPKATLLFAEHMEENVKTETGKPGNR